MPSKRRQGPAPRGRTAGGRRQVAGASRRDAGLQAGTSDAARSAAANDIVGVLLIVAAVCLLLALLVPTSAVVTTAVAQGLTHLFGRGAALVPVALLVFAVTFFLDEEEAVSGRVALGLALIVLSVLSLISLNLTGAVEDPSMAVDGNVVGDAGGYVGGAVAWALLTLVGQPVGNVILVGVIVCGTVVCGFSISGAVARLREGASEAAGSMRARREERRALREAARDAGRLPEPATPADDPWDDGDAQAPDVWDSTPATTYLGARQTSVLLRRDVPAGTGPGAEGETDARGTQPATGEAKTTVLQAGRRGDPARQPRQLGPQDAPERPREALPWEEDPKDKAQDPTEQDPFALPIPGLDADGTATSNEKTPDARGAAATGGQSSDAATGGTGDAGTTTAPSGRRAARQARARTAAPAKAAQAPDEDGYRLPPLSMLRSNPATRQSAATAQELRQTMQRLQATLNQFGLSARVVDYVSGPLVTTFRVEMGEGERVSKVVNLSDDIALTLAAESVRIMPHIPGTSLVGIEIPNASREDVYLGDVIPYAKGGPLEVAVGRDAGGTPIVADIATMPHLLVAGSTGSGKSVMINSMIMTLLMRTTPRQVRLILVDPKRVEFSGYNGLPHLYVPVVTEPRQAASALAWAVSEMERRLKVFERAGARDIRVYNRMCTSGKLAEMDNPPEPMPYLVVIIDELADLMMVAGKDVEASIVRLAQLARAAGIHLILATQRPSADVVTGLIKSNIDNRVALKVSSSIDSRVILDATGAEKLLGNGDMLFKYRGHATRRILGCYTSDAEIESVVDFIRQQAEPDYHEEILTAAVPSEQAGKSSAPGADDDDPLVWEAAQIVVDSQLGSTSGLQRQLSVGYARAGRIMDMLAAKGVVGPPNGSKPREVLLDKEGLEELRQAESAYGEVS